MRKPVVSRTIKATKFVCDIYSYSQEEILREQNIIVFRALKPDEAKRKGEKIVASQLTDKKRLIRVIRAVPIKCTFEMPLEQFRKQAKLKVIE